MGKDGDEGNQLIFKILKRGEHEASGQADLALRYDLTVPLARVIAHHQSKLPRLFKRYQIQPVWRADRPARGRFREFYQCDVDFLGTSSPMVEAELCAAVSDVLIELGFADFKIRLNHRRLLTWTLNLAGIPESLHVSALVALDKLDKIAPAPSAMSSRAGVGAESATLLFTDGCASGKPLGTHGRLRREGAQRVTRWRNRRFRTSAKSSPRGTNSAAGRVLIQLQRSVCYRHDHGIGVVTAGGLGRRRTVETTWWACFWRGSPASSQSRAIRSVMGSAGCQPQWPPASRRHAGGVRRRDMPHACRWPVCAGGRVPSSGRRQDRRRIVLCSRGFLSPSQRRRNVKGTPTVSISRQGRTPTNKGVPAPRF